MGSISQYLGLTIRTAEFALALACALTALGFGSDPVLLGIVLAAGWALGSLGLLTTGWTAKAKGTAIIGILLFFAAEGGFLRWHALSQQTDSGGEGATLEVLALPVRALKNTDTYVYPMKWLNVGTQSVTGFTYHFDQRIYSRKLSISEIDKSFENGFKHVKLELTQFDIFAAPETYPSGTGETFIEPNGQYNKAAVDAIKHGRLFLYDFFVMAYSDKVSRKTKSIYCAEARYYYDAAYDQFQQCAPEHTFAKLLWPPKPPY